MNRTLKKSKPNWLFRFACFVTQVDMEELQKCGLYDRNLMFRSFAAQILGFIFAFGIAMFSLRTLLSPQIAALIAIVLALIHFFVDQAIIASEWKIGGVVARYTIFNRPLSFSLKIIQMLPRMIYAIIIAVCFAHLAETEFQRPSIERVLRQETKEENREFLARKDSLVATHKSQIKPLDAEHKALLAAINLKKNPTAQSQQDNVVKKLKFAAERQQELATTYAELQRKITHVITKISVLHAAEIGFQSQIKNQQEQKNKEMESGGCRTPGKNICKGDNWNLANDLQQEASRELAKVTPELRKARFLLAEIKTQMKITGADLATANHLYSNLQHAVASLTGDSRSLSELAKLIGALKVAKSELLDIQKIQLKNLTNELNRAGYFEAAIYGPQDLRHGLDMLHADPKKGPSAIRFSIGLTMFLVLFELAPTLTIVFFSPYSFYATRMRDKRDEDLAQAEMKKIERDKHLNEKRGATHFPQSKRYWNIRHNLEIQKLLNEIQKLKHQGMMADGLMEESAPFNQTRSAAE